VQHTLAARRFAFIVGMGRFLKGQEKPQWAVQITEGTHLMKWKIIFRWSCLCLFLLLTACEDADVGMMVQASADAVRAATLSDEDVRRLAQEIAKQSDRKHAVAPADTPYTQRLQRLVGNNVAYDGHAFNIEVYLSPMVNAFAMAEGTIRIYSGLMDMLDDRELLFVVGHEMGHVTKKHIQKKIRLAYAGSAVRKAIASQHNEAGDIARSSLGALAERLLNAQFSQQEEREADDYGVIYLRKMGHDRQPAISALTKLASLGNEHSFLSSHPAPEDRARRLSKNSYAIQAVSGPSVLERFWEWLTGFWPS
jgi:putative metalloprotease